MDDIQKMVIAISLTAVIVGSCSYILLHDVDKDDGPSEIDITGQWYPTHFEEYYDSGSLSVMEYDDPYLTQWGLNIISVHDSIVHGIFAQDDFVGSYLNGIIAIYSDSDGIYGTGKQLCYFKVIDEDTMYEIYTSTEDGIGLPFRDSPYIRGISLGRMPPR